MYPKTKKNLHQDIGGNLVKKCVDISWVSHAEKKSYPNDYVPKLFF